MQRGEATLARARQGELSHPYLVTGFDDLIFMSAPRYYGGARALVDGGNDVIFDHVLHDREAYESMVEAFGRLDVYVVHTFCDYDVMVDTGAQDAGACVAHVLDVLGPPDRAGDRSGN